MSTYIVSLPEMKAVAADAPFTPPPGHGPPDPITRHIGLGWQWSPEWAVEESVRQINATGEVDEWQRVIGPFVGLDAVLGPRVG